MVLRKDKVEIGNSRLDPSSPLTIILVHGTWAKFASWTKPNSSFAKALSKSLGPDLRRKIFNWSGGNSHAARLEAGHKLSAFVRHSLQSDPCSRHVVIAQSHGGNIALYALQDEDIRKNVSAIVCLSTPFLNCWARELLPPKARAFLKVLLIALMLISFGAILQNLKVSDWKMEWIDSVFSRLQDWGVPGTLLQILAIICLFVPVMLGIEAVQHLLGWIDDFIHEWFAQRALTRLTQLGPPLMHVPPILCVVLKRDEARVGLRILSRVADFPNVLNAKLAGLISAWVVWAYLIGGVLIRKLVGNLSADLDFFLEAGLFLGAIFLGFMLLVLPFVIIVASALIRGHRFAFGEQLLDNLLIRTDVEKTPGKIWPPATLIELTVSDEFRERSGLRHSFVYQDIRVVEIIADWLKHRHGATAGDEQELLHG